MRGLGPYGSRPVRPLAMSRCAVESARTSIHGSTRTARCERAVHIPLAARPDSSITAHATASAEMGNARTTGSERSGNGVAGPSRRDVADFGTCSARANKGAGRLAPGLAADRKARCSAATLIMCLSPGLLHWIGRLQCGGHTTLLQCDKLSYVTLCRRAQLRQPIAKS